MKAQVFIFLVVAVLFVPACGTPEQRAADHLVKAEELLASGDIVKAKLEAQNAAQIEPRNAKARMLLAEMAEQEGDVRAAVGHLLVAIDSDPDLLDARVRLGNFYFLGRATEQAVEQAAKAMELAPDDPKVRLLNARVKFLQGDRDAAATETEAALAADPALVDAIMFKAGLAGEQEKWEEAFAIVQNGLSQVAAEDSQPLRQFRVQLMRRTGRQDEVEAEILKLIEDFPDEEAYQYALVQYYMQEDEAEKAEALMRRIAAKDPADTERQLNLARYLANAKGFEATEEFLASAVAAQPEALSLRAALGRLYESNKLVDKARTVYREVVAQAPRSEEGFNVRNRLVSMHIAAEELDEAREAVDAILTDAPDNTGALLYRAAFAYVDQDFDVAIADLRVLLRKEEASEPGLLLLARSYVRSGDTALAQDAYRRLLAINPKHSQAPGELANLLARQGDAAEAESVLRARLEVDPEDSGAASGLVQTLLAQQDLDAAEAEARRLVEMNEKNALAQFQLGRVMQAKESPAEAIAAYKATLAENPRATGALQGLASVLLQNGRGTEALSFLQQHRRENPDLIDARFIEAAVHAQLGDKNAARQGYEDVLAESPKAVRAYTALAGLEDELAERIKILERGFNAIPNSAQIGLVLASSLERDRRWEESIAVYEKLLAANPENMISVNNLAALLLDRRNDTASHERAMELALKLSENDQPPLLDTVGWAYYRNNDYVNAVRYLERAVAGASDVPILRYHLGMAYAANNNPVGAKQALERAIADAKTDFDGIEEARAKLAEL